MSLLESVNKDVISAMKAKEKEKLEALRYLKSLLIQNNTEVRPKAEMDILVSHVKKLNDSIEMYQSDPEAQNKIKNEIEFLNVYMPKQLEESEVVAIIQEIISNLESPQMGPVMKELGPKIKGKFDGKKASELVKKALS